MAQVEAIVNAEILVNAPAQAEVMKLEDAQHSGAMMLFGEKYGESVRVLSIGSSKELCGGTHVQRTGDIGLFKLVAESGVAAGIRRVEAITGQAAVQYLQQLEWSLGQAAGLLKVTPLDVPQRIQGLQEQMRALEKETAALKGRLASAQGDELLSQATTVGEVQVLAAQLEGADAKALRETLDKLKDKLKTEALQAAGLQAYHPPCTLQHGQQLKGGVEKHLGDLGFQIKVTSNESHLCCGSAGTYSVLNPDLSKQLRDRKLGHLNALEPQGVISANIGCITHLQSGSGLPVRHWVELVDGALLAG
jgi:alanyl-tRNA synthetase